jgi:hypothetical protein
MKKGNSNIYKGFTAVAAILIAVTLQVKSQNVSVNNTDITVENENNSNIIILEGPVEENKISDNITDNQSGNKRNAENQETKNVIETARFSQEELTNGIWVLERSEITKINSINITKWNTTESDLKAVCTWKDKIDIVHTVESGFKWQDPPKSMKPGEYLNLEAIYTNIDYSTTSNILIGVKMFFERVGGDLKNPEANAIEVMKLNKDRKSYANEVKKGFFYAPKYYFDATNQCQLVVDCYIGKDHYITTYTYTYQQ